MAAALLLVAAVSAGAAPAVAGSGLAATAAVDVESLTQIADGSQAASATRTEIGSAAANSDDRADEAPNQLLSTLGSLALGIIGLLWIRRHTAEL